MTKADIINDIYQKTGIEKQAVSKTIESFMGCVKNTMSTGKNVYLRGFGTFEVKKRAQKTAQNISKNTTIIIPEHHVPSFKPSQSFVEQVKKNVK